MRLENKVAVITGGSRGIGFATVEKFLNEPSDEPRLLYLWGHSYEKDMQEEYLGNFEKICQMLSGKDDIYYGTNKEVLL